METNANKSKTPLYNRNIKVNIRVLWLVMFATLLFSFLWVSITETILFSSYSLGEHMYLNAILGYIEVAVGYILLLLLLYGINYFIKKERLLFVTNIIMLFVIWASVFSCIEVWVLFLFSSKSTHEYDIILYLPPFYIKFFAFFYYIYKITQGNKKTNSNELGIE